MTTVGYKQLNTHHVFYFKRQRLTDPQTVNEVEQELMEHLESLPMQAQVVINFDGVESVSSQIIGLMLGAKRTIADRFGSLSLCRVGPYVLDILKLTRLDSQFEIYERMRDVVGDVATGQPAARRETVPAGRATRSSNETDWID